MPTFIRQTKVPGLPAADAPHQEPLTDHSSGWLLLGKGGLINMPPSPADSTLLDSPQKSDGNLMAKEQKRITRDFGRGAPGDATIFAAGKTAGQNELAKRRSQYYGDAFAQRESNTSARERVLKESIVMAEILTNVIVHDEYTLITDLSYNLSNRYQRPESSILVTIRHSACLLLAASFDPAYILTITAVPSLVQPVTNKRNTVLLQRLIEESLGVPPSRGVVKFLAIPEENYAFNGKTVAGDIEDLEKVQGDDSASLRRSQSRSGTKTAIKRQSMRSFRNLKAGIIGGSIYTNPKEPLTPRSDQAARLTPPLSEPDSPALLPATANARPATAVPKTAVPMPTIPKEKSAMDIKTEKLQKMSRRKSFMSGLFGR